MDHLSVFFLNLLCVTIGTQIVMISSGIIFKRLRLCHCKRYVFAMFQIFQVVYILYEEIVRNIQQKKIRTKTNIKLLMRPVFNIVYLKGIYSLLNLEFEVTRSHISLVNTRQFGFSFATQATGKHKHLIICLV